MTSNIAPADQPTAVVRNRDLKPGSKLALDCHPGCYARVNGDVYRSSRIPGIMVVETEIGSLYLDPDEITNTIVD